MLQEFAAGPALRGEGHLLLFTHWAEILRQFGAEQIAAPERQKVGWFIQRLGQAASLRVLR